MGSAPSVECEEASIGARGGRANIVVKIMPMVVIEFGVLEPRIEINAA